MTKTTDRWNSIAAALASTVAGIMARTDAGDSRKLACVAALLAGAGREATDRHRLDAAFAVLEARGYFARQRHTCCQSCGWAAVPVDAAKVAFDHDQDAEALDADGWLRRGGMFLAWRGTASHGHEVVEVLQACGLGSVWTGSLASRIQAESSRAVRRFSPPDSVDRAERALGVQREEDR